MYPVRVKKTCAPMITFIWNSPYIHSSKLNVHIMNDVAGVCWWRQHRPVFGGAWNSDTHGARGQTTNTNVCTRNNRPTWNARRNAGLNVPRSCHLRHPFFMILLFVHLPSNWWYFVQFHRHHWFICAWISQEAVTLTYVFFLLSVFVSEKLENSFLEINVIYIITCITFVQDAS